MKKALRRMWEKDVVKVIVITALVTLACCALAWVLSTYTGIDEFFDSHSLYDSTTMKYMSIIISIGTIIFNLIHWIKG